MKNEKLIHIFVKITKTEHRDITFNTQNITGAEIKEAAGLSLDSNLFSNDGKLVVNDQTVIVKNGDHFAVVPHGAITYAVDDEIQWTIEKELTPVQIMKDAGIDSDANYLKQIVGNNQQSYKDTPTVPIHMHNGMVFITVFMGPKPVSNCE